MAVSHPQTKSRAFGGRASLGSGSVELGVTSRGLTKGCVPAVAGTKWKGKIVILNYLPGSNLTCGRQKLPCECTVDLLTSESPKQGTLGSVVLRPSYASEPPGRPFVKHQLLSCTPRVSGSVGLRWTSSQISGCSSGDHT